MQRKTSDFRPATPASYITTINIFSGLVFCSTTVFSLTYLGMNAYGNHFHHYATTNFFSLLLLTSAITTALCSILFTIRKFYGTNEHNNEKKYFFCWLLTTLPALFFINGMLVLGAASFMLAKNVNNNYLKKLTYSGSNHSLTFWGVGLVIVALSTLILSITFFFNDKKNTKPLAYFLFAIFAVSALYSGLLIGSSLASSTPSFKIAHTFNSIIFITGIIVGFGGLVLLAPIWAGDAECNDTVEKKINLTKNILPIACLMLSFATGSYIVHGNYNAYLCLMVGLSLMSLSLFLGDLTHRLLLCKQNATFTLPYRSNRLRQITNIGVPILLFSGTTLMSIAMIKYNALPSNGLSLSVNDFKLFISGAALMAFATLIEFFQIERGNADASMTSSISSRMNSY